ncbi:MAG: hypothetical protein GWN81_15325, partial [Phycisphaerae bacterium]|nr:hypothetical protein [Phycisphaerae bacterium]NIW45299.1 hypothetical protein [Gammaproteobacteria bacterium]NIP53794.1 hypothetical protein [Phycisphaerae bacterium]NIU10187.1 hypothetical protein [Phycisphaerae bacterium]NIX00113.1 hypothetical protein [Phycisphaerae bacterium]
MSQSTLLPFLENHSGIATPVNQRHLWKQSRRQLEQQGVRSTPLGRFSGRKSRGYKIIEQLAGKGLRYTGLEPRGRRNALNIELRQIELTFANLPPAFDGYRLMHLSDL